MNSDIRRQWQVALAALLIWSTANLIGSAGQAADADPAAASDAEAQAIADRLDAMIERAAARLGAGVWSDRVGSRLRPVRIIACCGAVALVLLAAASPLAASCTW